jgi:transcriptional regulator with XRE-family HTH domain
LILAYENGMSKGYLSDIEKGNKLPSLTILDQIADPLGVDIKELF